MRQTMTWSVLCEKFSFLSFTAFKVMIKTTVLMCRETTVNRRTAWNTWPRVIKRIVNVMIQCRSIWCHLRMFRSEWVLVRTIKRVCLLLLRTIRGWSINVVIIFPSLLPSVNMSTRRWIDIEVIYTQVCLRSINFVLLGFLSRGEVKGRFGCGSV